MAARARTPEEKARDDGFVALRKEMLDQFRQTDEKDLSDAQLLALLLSFSIDKCDYRAAAEQLLLKFGSLETLLNMRLDALQTEPMLKFHTALMLKCIPALCHKMMMEMRPKRIYIRTPQDAELYLAPYFVGYNYEQAYLLLLNDQYYPKKTVFLSDGSGNDVYIDANKILREALMQNSTKVILAHSHPGGYAVPSRSDIISTAVLSGELSKLGIRLLDHLIFARKSCSWMSSDDEMDSSILAFSDRAPMTVQQKRAAKK